ncbi:phosphate ABC transporter permease PstA [Rheinheimera sp. SM2107]|uniref:Phosphate transport system permease protein PstA n=1 Tax=Arsukibacterium indicum TaxID=2848612 RepID=A0ABS6MPM8_9GAMM|nr:phosphate ABC transporter permease PstA [Arsukibacterium indicum]MBV2130783.1 phosphate ABC transporter permease PstA [Arsukibacterium indicum]
MLRNWFRQGAPWIWLNAGAVAMSLLLVFGLLAFIVVQSIGVFWPSELTGHTGEKLLQYLVNWWQFLSGSSGQAGIFPAILGTVLMVLLMSVLVTPLGVLAAVYLHEYAKEGLLLRLIRVAVHNLAGVPSIVFGVFGLGFFVYYLGGNIDNLFFNDSLPTPTFGTPGLLWVSLTLALLTLPVVIVATEQGLAGIPKNLRLGCFALGATKAEVIWKIVLPQASPAMVTALMLAIARAAGEVAPLVFVGVVKSVSELPLSSDFPYLQLQQKITSLSMHIYDAGLQSPDAQRAEPLVFASALVLITLIFILNLLAYRLRKRLALRYRNRPLPE